MSITVQDSGDLAAVLKVNGLTDTSSISAGDTVKLTVKGIGGSEDYTYTYKAYNGSKWTTLAKNQSDATYSYTVKTAGSYRYVVVVTDGNGDVVETNKVDLTVE